ncbi:MAG: GGDEF domain-containing protein [Eubacteriales bacterium]
MIKRVLAIVLVLTIAFFYIPASAEHEYCDYKLPPKNILVLFSYSPSYPSFDMLIDGLNVAFSEKNVHLQVEYMDTKLIDLQTAEALLLQQLQSKLDLLDPISMVITFDDNALAFIDKYHETLFGADSADIPIVFSGCNDYEAATAIFNARNNIVGRLEPTSRIKTIDIATRLIPDYSSITVLLDNSTTAQGVKAQLIAENVNDYPLTFINSTDYTYDELAAKLTKLTPKDIFLFVACYEDSAGSKMTYTQSANFVYTTLNTPIFSTTSFNIDSIFAGGYVHDKNQSGYDTGLVARAILFDGASAKDFGLSSDKDADMTYMFNVDILSQYDLSTSALPQAALRIHHSSTHLINNADSELQRHLIILSILLGVGIFIVAGFAVFRNSKARQHEQNALTDSLTGAGSRLALDNKLNVLIQYCLDAGVSATLVFLDIDGFKTVNDRYGHPVGDAILKQVIARIQSAMSKKSDIYRFGGDEFVILMRMPANEAKEEINEITIAFKRRFSCGNHLIPVNLSMGAVEIPLNGTDAQTLISKADTAMYAAKTFNATRAIFYTNLR